MRQSLRGGSLNPTRHRTHNISDFFTPLNADTFDEIEAKREGDKWVYEGATYLMWNKNWKKVDGGMQRKWNIKKSYQRSVSNG